MDELRFVVGPGGRDRGWDVHGYGGFGRAAEAHAARVLLVAFEVRAAYDENKNLNKRLTTKRDAFQEHGDVEG